MAVYAAIVPAAHGSTIFGHRDIEALAIKKLIELTGTIQPPDPATVEVRCERDRL